MIKETFDQIKATEKLKTKTYAYVLKHAKKTHYPKLLLSFGAFVLVFVMTYYLYFLPVSYISFDLNPSLELTLNRFDRVIAIKAYNDDGADLVEGLSFFGADYNDVLQELIASPTIQTYLSNDEVLSITLICDDEHKKQDMEESIGDYIDDYENIHCHEASSEYTSEAHHHNMSSGKYRYYLLLVEEGYDLEIDDVNSMSVKEILELLKDSSQDYNGHHGHH